MSPALSGILGLAVTLHRLGMWPVTANYVKCKAGPGGQNINSFESHTKKTFVDSNAFLSLSLVVELHIRGILKMFTNLTTFLKLCLSQCVMTNNETVYNRKEGQKCRRHNLYRQ